MRWRIWRHPALIFFAIVVPALLTFSPASISTAIIPQAVPTANKVGNSTAFQLAGTVSGTGATICTDANQNTTTVGCTTASGTVNTGNTPFLPWYASNGTTLSQSNVAITNPASQATLAPAAGKTITLSNTLTFTGTDGSSVNFGTGGTVLYAVPATPHSVSLTVTGGSSVFATGPIGLSAEAEVASTTGIYKVVVNGSAAASGNAQTNCSFTADIWKVSAGIPTSGNKISASDPATLSAANFSTDTALTGWSKTVSAGDVFTASVATNASCIAGTIQIWWQ